MRVSYWLGIFLAIFLIQLAVPVYAQDPPLPTPVGRVVWVKGILLATMPNKEERKLVKSSVIYLHDTLSTDADSQAQIVFTDNTLMTFRQNTKFSIDQYSYKPSTKKGSVGKYFMNLLEGGFRTITGLIAKSNPSDYQVNTPVATIGVRGTDFQVYVQGTQVFMGFYDGKPCITSKGVGKELCLSSTVPYAEVPNANTPPIPLKEPPEVLKTKLDIVPAKIEPFASNTTSGAPRQVQPSGPARGLPTGPVNSFCITQ